MREQRTVNSGQWERVGLDAGPARGLRFGETVGHRDPARFFLRLNDKPGRDDRGKRRKLGVVAALVGLAVLAGGCASISNPDGWAQPEVSSEKVMYVTLERGKLTAVETPSFQKIWTFPQNDEFSCGGGESKSYKNDGIYEPPAMDDLNVYFATYDGAVYSVKKSDGTCNWRVATDDTNVAGLVLGGEGLYVGANDGYTYLLYPEDGTTKEKFNTGAVWATPLLTDDALYVATMTGELWKLDPKTLQLKDWSAPFKVDAGLLSNPTLVDEKTLIVGGIGKTLYAIDTETGSQKWMVATSNWIWGDPYVDGSTIYVTDLDGGVKAVSATDGHELWPATFKALHSIRSGAVVVGDTLVVADNDGFVYRLDKASGSEIGQPNLLNETVHATPLVLNSDGTAVLRGVKHVNTVSPTASAQSASVSGATTSASASATPAASGSASEKAYIVTTKGHVFEFDADAGRSTQVVSK
jgi:outer membrane protein assembly factor BamB